MTINTTYTQSFAFSFTAYSMSRASASTIEDGTPAPSVSATESPASAPVSETPASAPVSEAPVSAPVDRVQLSSDATAQAASPTGSSAPQPGDALFGALDANKDGSITEQEFTDGAMALLRRAGARHHHRHVHGDDHEAHGDRDVRQSGRLERKLEKLFDSVDTNHDGSIDKDELTTALRQANGGQTPAPTPSPSTEPAASASTASAPQTASATSVPVPAPEAPVAPDTNAPVTPGESQASASVSVTRVTYLAVAVQQYTTIGEMR